MGLQLQIGFEFVPSLEYRFFPTSCLLFCSPKVVGSVAWLSTILCLSIIMACCKLDDEEEEEALGATASLRYAIGSSLSCRARS